MTATEEALLVSRTLAHPRHVVDIDTKAAHLKSEKQAAVEHLAAAAHGPVTLDHLAQRMKAQHEPARVTAPAEKRTRAEGPKEGPEVVTGESRRRDELEPQARTTAPQQAVAEPFRLEAPPPLQDAAPLAQVAPMLAEDPAARVVLMPHVARMAVDTGDGGVLQLQVKVRDGVAELTAAGPASQLLESRQGELRVSLAKEGLALGHFDLTQSGQQQRQHAERPDPESTTSPTPRRAAASSSTPDPVVEDGRVHVRA